MDIKSELARTVRERLAGMSDDELLSFIPADSVTFAFLSKPAPAERRRKPRELDDEGRGAAAAILEVLEGQGEGLSRGELHSAAGGPDNHFDAALRWLRFTGEVVTTGAKAGTKYLLAKGDD